DERPGRRSHLLGADRPGAHQLRVVTVGVVVGRVTDVEVGDQLRDELPTVGTREVLGGDDEPGTGRRHALATGMRGRWRAGAGAATKSPRRGGGAAPVTRTVAYDPGRSAAGGRKWTSLFCSVRPVVRAGSLRDGPSTRTSSSRPIRARCRASADRSTTSRRRS